MQRDISRRSLLKTGLAVPASLAMLGHSDKASHTARADQVTTDGLSMPFRQVHLDFHTSELIPGVADSFDPDEFASTLAAAHVNSVTCFARCHHGYLYYDTARPSAAAKARFFALGATSRSVCQTPRKTRLFRAINGIPPQVCWQPAMRQTQS